MQPQRSKAGFRLTSERLLFWTSVESGVSGCVVNVTRGAGLG